MRKDHFLNSWHKLEIKITQSIADKVISIACD